MKRGVNNPILTNALIDNYHFISLSFRFNFNIITFSYSQTKGQPTNLYMLRISSSVHHEIPETHCVLITLLPKWFHPSASPIEEHTYLLIITRSGNESLSFAEL